LTYSGTHGDIAQDDDKTVQMTDGTRKLIMSWKNEKPVRVIRKGSPTIKAKWYPACGYRYDGLYSVKRATLVRGRRDGDRDFYQFSLERLMNQKLLEEIKRIPDRDHKAAWGTLTGYI